MGSTELRPARQPLARRRAAVNRPARRPVLWAALLAALAAPLAPVPARAYVPDLQEIYQLVAQRQPAIQRAMIELRTYVFDPLHRTDGSEVSAPADAMPPELPVRAFRQKVWWIRNAFLGIETYADDGTPLHFYLDEGFRPVQGDLTPDRHFSEADVVPPFLPFVAADPATWRQAVTFWGINPTMVDIARGPKGEELYRLAENDDEALWLEPELLRPVKLQTRLMGDGGGQLLTVEFSEFMFIGASNSDVEDFYFPRTTNFLLDGKLFKQTVVLRFEADPSVQGFPITKLRTLAARVQPQEPVSFTPQAQGQP